MPTYRRHPQSPLTSLHAQQRAVLELQAVSSMYQLHHQTATRDNYGGSAYTTTFGGPSTGLLFVVQSCYPNRLHETI